MASRVNRRLVPWFAILLAVLLLGRAVFAQGGSQQLATETPQGMRGTPQVTPTEAAQAMPTGTPQVTHKLIIAKTLEAARGLVDFTVQAPGTVPSSLSFLGAGEYETNRSYLLLVYKRSDEVSGAAGGNAPPILQHDGGRHRVIITESPANFSSGDPSTPITVEGVTGEIVHGEDIGNPGLVVIFWQKDGLSFSASTFPTESFTEQDLITLVNSFE